jgi:2-polyprenyl-6-methoxyphenol hydroxylase-like FAD-dependent oxidoreductase
MIERDVSRPPLAESLPPSCLPLLDAIGVRSAIDAAGFIRGTGNTVWWGGAPMRVEPFPGGRSGYQVARAALESVLTECAVAAGVVRLCPGTVTRVTRDGVHHVLDVSTPSGPERISAPWVLDCSGRAGLLARQARVASPDGIRTIALVCVWERASGWPVPESSHTLVESADWGWGWSVPLTETRRCFTAMVDPTATSLVSDAGLIARYDALMASLPALGALLSDARRLDAPWACDATPYHNSEVAPDGALFVGDAASMIDPLSSFGVKKALASAWLAAVVVHTAFVTPEHTALARALFRDREAAYVRSASHALSDVSREAGRAEPFWSARAAAGEHDDASDDLNADGRVPAVPCPAALCVLREAPSILRANHRTWNGAPCGGAGNVVVPDVHLRLPGLSESVRYLRDVDLVALLELAPRHRDVGAMYADYARAVGAVALPDFLGALSVLVAKGALRLA